MIPKMWNWSLIRQIIYILELAWLIKSVVHAFDIEKCPFHRQWKLRAKAFCYSSQKNYSCLFEVIQKKYRESCKGTPDYVKPGQRYVIRGDRDSDDCSDSRFQPFKLWSNQSSDCQFLKYDCNEMGQIIASNGSTIKDRTCRCNYHDGFDFVVKPKNICYCIPSKEDCSCYWKRCFSDEILTKDYECAKVNHGVHNGSCPPIVQTRKLLNDSSSTLRPRLSRPKYILKGRGFIEYISPLVFVLFAILLSSSFILVMVPCQIVPPKLFVELLEYMSHTINSCKIDFKVNERNSQIGTPPHLNIISANRKCLTEEMDTTCMRHQMFVKTRDERFLNIDNKLSRSEQASIICDIIEEDIPKYLYIVYEILQEMDMHLIFERLKTYDRIFKFDHEEILRKRIESNLKDIVERVTEKDLIDDILIIFEERLIVYQQIEDICKKCYYDEENKITQIVNYIVKGDLYLMLNFVNALCIVGEEEYEKKLLQ